MASPSKIPSQVFVRILSTGVRRSVHVYSDSHLLNQSEMEVGSTSKIEPKPSLRVALSSLEEKSVDGVL